MKFFNVVQKWLVINKIYFRYVMLAIDFMKVIYWPELKITIEKLALSNGLSDKVHRAEEKQLTFYIPIH